MLQVCDGGVVALYFILNPRAKRRKLALEASSAGSPPDPQGGDIESASAVQVRSSPEIPEMEIDRATVTDSTPDTFNAASEKPPGTVLASPNNDHPSEKNVSSISPV